MSQTKLLEKGDVMLLDRPRYGLAVSWDRIQTTVDIDLQAVMVDKKGTIVDAVYYNNLQDVSTAVCHTGDEETGDAGGYDEMIWVNFAKVPESIQLIIFVVAAYSGGHLRDVDNAMVHIVEEKHWKLKSRIQLLKAMGDVAAVAMIRRTREGTWCLVPTSQSAQPGRHFMDIIRPTMSDLIRKAIPTAPVDQKVCFPMKKGSRVDLPQASVLKRIHVGIGWDINQTAGNGVDLDLSAVFFHNTGRDIGAVYFDNTVEYGLSHKGDNQTGEGDGDDEVITVELGEVPAEIAQIFFVINAYTKDVTLASLNNAYCRVFDDSDNELVRFTLADACDKSGLVISRLYKSRFGRWEFQAVGKFCRGRTWMDPCCMSDLKKIFHHSVQDIESDLVQPTSPKRHATPRTISKERQVVDIRSKNTISLQRGERVALPDSLQRLFVGVGWDIVRSFRRGADLDVSTVLFDETGGMVGSIYFDNMCQFGVTHSGDNTTGEGDGDDEVIQFDLHDIPEEVVHMFVCVNCYTKGMTFDAIPNAYCRVVHETGHELLRFDLDSVDHKRKPGLVMCRLTREDGHWGFEATGRFSGGRTWMDPACMAMMKRAVFLSEMKRECVSPLLLSPTWKKESPWETGMPLAEGMPIGMTLRSGIVSI